MVKKIIQIADLHIRNLRRVDEYKEQLTLFIEQCEKLITNPEEWRIVIVGDIFNSKIISPEATLMVGWFFSKLDDICKTIVIAGNHDTINISNENRVDNLTPIFKLSNYKQCIYLDSVLNYESGCYIDDNIVWVLYSVFNNKMKPNDIEEIKLQKPESKFIGLIHGEIQSAKTDIGWECEIGVNTSIFEGLDSVMLGHIHKHQIIKKDGINLCYSSSLIQQDFGENVRGHGFVIWDIETMTCEFKELLNDKYGFFKFTINCEDDILNNTEKLLNI